MSIQKKSNAKLKSFSGNVSHTQAFSLSFYMIVQQASQSSCKNVPYIEQPTAGCPFYQAFISQENINSYSFKAVPFHWVTQFIIDMVVTQRYMKH